MYFSAFCVIILEKMRNNHNFYPSFHCSPGNNLATKNWIAHHLWITKRTKIICAKSSKQKRLRNDVANSVVVFSIYTPFFRGQTAFTDIDLLIWVCLVVRVLTNEKFIPVPDDRCHHFCHCFLHVIFQKTKDLLSSPFHGILNWSTSLIHCL